MPPNSHGRELSATGPDNTPRDRASRRRPRRGYVRAAAKTKKAKKPGGKPGPKPRAASPDGGSIDQVIRQLAWSHGLLAIEASLKKVRAEAGL
jgi:hypothetical protein